MNKEREIWFARRHPIGHHSRAMAPVHWKGWAISTVFMLVMLGAGGALLWYGLNNELFHGVAIFAVLAIVFGGWFTLVSRANGDHVRTAADYKREKSGV